MLHPDHCFYQVCAGEMGVILAGIVSLPAAVVLQVLVLLVIFRAHFLPPAYLPVPFVGALVLVPVVFALVLVFFRHPLIPLMVLAAFAAIAWFSIFLAGTRLQRRYGGGVP